MSEDEHPSEPPPADGAALVEGGRGELPDEAIIARIDAGDHAAFGRLFDRWFEHVLDLAYHVLWDEDAAADVARDAFRAAWDDLDELTAPSRFGAWVLGIARTMAIERQHGVWRSRPFGPPEVPPEDKLLGLTDPADLAHDEFCATVIWDAAESLGARDHDALDLRYRHGLDALAIAEVLVLPMETVDQIGPRAGQRLTSARRARVLWRDGEPLCSALRAELMAADVEGFDAEAVHVTDRHAALCAACTARSQFELSAADMLAALPLLTSPTLKARVAYALVNADVPMGGAVLFGAGAVAGSSRPRRRRRRGLWAAAITATALIGGIVLGAAALSHDSSPTAAVAPPTTTTTRSSTTTSSASSSTSTSTTSTTTSTSTTTTTLAPIVVPPLTVPATTRPTSTTTTVPRTVSLTLTPGTIVTGYALTGAPLLTWNVTGATTVKVGASGGDVTSSAASGSQRVCPFAGATTTCSAPPGSYTYSLDAYGAGGTRFAHRTVTLTITSS